MLARLAEVHHPWWFPTALVCQSWNQMRFEINQLGTGELRALFLPEKSLRMDSSKKGLLCVAYRLHWFPWYWQFPPVSLPRRAVVAEVGLFVVVARLGRTEAAARSVATAAESEWAAATVVVTAMAAMVTAVA